ncbi:DEAD/DEAH box helicase [Sansalvadorimonas verongulae]|uniref:DEAD/DEAH box helicase n=1 Tax=Sansalvadorimonas verongulae TaxID=2172824 RepID=UPI0012BC3109|nr:DEAD/DEAH box helicase [Sansalvadorimonas verongulae]MTI13184.1 DEAD/DEAH box helicase [Sansalvadorimonas verongulae]
MYTLRPYQEDAISACLKSINPNSAQIAVLGTGAGKSIIIAEVIKRLSGKVLVLSRSKEITSQNAEKYQALTGERPSIFNAGLKQKCLKERAVFASVQSLYRLAEEDYPEFKLIIIDECHQAGLEAGTPETSQYNTVIRHAKRINHSVSSLGLTATPYRLKTGGEVMNWFIYGGKGCYWDDVCYSISESELTKMGYLAPLKYNTMLEPLFSGEGAKVNGNDITSSELSFICDDTTKVRSAIAHTELVASSREGGCILFCATREQTIMAEQQLKSDSKAVLLADTPAKHRDSILKRFKDGEIKYLINLAVLTTGFDAPNITTLSLMRPTASKALHEQIIGRGMRLAEGKTECLVLDFTDNAERLLDAAQLSDLHRNEMSEEDGGDEERKESEAIFCPTCHTQVSPRATMCTAYLKQEDGGYAFCKTPVNTISCPVCGTQNGKHDENCKECKTHLKKTEECSFCHAQTPAGSPYCTSCGLPPKLPVISLRSAVVKEKRYHSKNVFMVTPTYFLFGMKTWAFEFHFRWSGYHYKEVNSVGLKKFMLILAPVLKKVGISTEAQRLAFCGDDDGLRDLLKEHKKAICGAVKTLYVSFDRDPHGDGFTPFLQGLDILPVQRLQEIKQAA